MFTIQFGRYVPTLKSVKCKSGRIYNAFDSVIDHTKTIKESNTSLEKIITVAHTWLHDHYGFVIVIMDNQDEDDESHKWRLCNYKRMRSDFHKMGLEVRLNNHIF